MSQVCRNVACLSFISIQWFYVDALRFQSNRRRHSKASVLLVLGNKTAASAVGELRSVQLRKWSRRIFDLILVPYRPGRKSLPQTFFLLSRSLDGCSRTVAVRSIDHRLPVHPRMKICRESGIVARGFYLTHYSFRSFMYRQDR